MLKRKLIKSVKAQLDRRPEWNVVDLGCQFGGWSQAGTLVDRMPLHDHYPGRRFVQADVCQTPFFDHEFDFAVASHIAEHVTYPAMFLRELMRVARRGYIETPLPLFDNLVYGNPAEHLWWVTMDDEAEQLVFRPRKNLLRESCTIDMWNFLGEHFREATVLELYWEGSIPYRIEDGVGEIAVSQLRELALEVIL